MARKPVNEILIKKIITLKATNSTISQIQKETGLSKATIENYVKKYQHEIDVMREDNLNIQEVMNMSKNESKNENKKTDKKTMSKNESKNEKKQEFASLEDETTRKTITRASQSVSELKAKEITEDYKAAQMLHSASVRYRKNIEMMGLEWDRFIAFSIDSAYERAVDAYKEKVEEQLREASLLEMAITEELENPRPKTEDGMMIEEQEE